MENGKQWFHSDSKGLHLLFEPFLLDEESGLLPGYIFIGIMCASERGITYYLDHKSATHTKIVSSTGECIFNIITRTVLYGIVTILRLLYMLVVMYFNTGLFILVVSSLTLSQLIIEIIKSSHCNNKTGPLTKFQNKGYSDLRTVDQVSNEEEDEDDHYNNEARIRQYNIPRIVISNEKCCSSSTGEERRGE